MLIDIIKKILLCKIGDNLRILLMTLKNDIMENPKKEYYFICDHVDNINIGDLIGEGDTKKCYNITNHNDIVIKTDKYKLINACFVEFMLWCVVKNTTHEKYFAPCIAISNNMKSVIMKKVNNVINPEKYLKTYDEIRCFCDKLEYFEVNSDIRNFGLYDDELVLCDYSIQTKFDQRFFNLIAKLTT